MPKKIQLTEHAKFEIKRRRINEKLVQEVVRNPTQVIGLKSGRQVCQTKYFDEFTKKAMLLRVIIEETTGGIKIITAYKTSKLGKYWKKGGHRK
ncbi:MAG: DUF4258 domain-containing protein [candidate division Zixibacteria bacterium]|nr:DUF4258 domain-containing protein [candidate division Zixibacteria bacterium]